MTKGFKHYWLWLPVVWAMSILLITSIQLPERTTDNNEVGFVFVSEKHEHANKLLAAFVRTANQKGFIPVPTTSEDSRVLEKEKLDAMIDRGVEAIFVTTLDESFIRPSLERAEREGIPIIAIDRMIDHESVLTSVMSDNVEIGRMAANHIVAKHADLDRPIRVVEVRGTAKVRSTIDRSLGLTEYDKANDSLQVVASISGNYDTFQAEIEMSRWLEADIPFDAVFSHNDDNTFGVVRALESHGLTDKTLVSVDGVTGIYPLIHEGKVDATIVQSPNEMIEVGFKALELHLNGKKIASHYYSSSYLYEGLVKD
ncbi:sugar ABC transporter substrate-binding protein [Exiguobacterium sp. AM39-5BH]|uniref:sugar ABC transporter substrate-binding protein n=1 Tax=Exiguobacterium sp. AM39-5BH TaxID=2292355 RepID=UPI000FE1C470|nr:sugar ABC transporter substrate-binding protein [Exiguobacterium sp. AM39-5BH]RHB51824.1 sugar ABC transporter substrate-binding protein [Exiguobacterium sp. AM39-5BH]